MSRAAMASSILLPGELRIYRRPPPVPTAKWESFPRSTFLRRRENSVSPANSSAKKQAMQRWAHRHPQGKLSVTLHVGVDTYRYQLLRDHPLTPHSPIISAFSSPLCPVLLFSLVPAAMQCRCWGKLGKPFPAQRSFRSGKIRRVHRICGRELSISRKSVWHVRSRGTPAARPRACLHRSGLPGFFRFEVDRCQCES